MQLLTLKCTLLNTFKDTQTYIDKNKCNCSQNSDDEIDILTGNINIWKLEITNGIRIPRNFDDFIPNDGKCYKKV